MQLLLRRLFSFFSSSCVAGSCCSRIEAHAGATTPLQCTCCGGSCVAGSCCSRIEAHAGATTPLRFFCASSVLHVLLCRCCCRVDFIALLALPCCCSLWLSVTSHERKKNASRRHFINALLTRRRYLNSYWGTRLSSWRRFSSRTIVTPLVLLWTAMKE